MISDLLYVVPIKYKDAEEVPQSMNTTKVQHKTLLELLQINSFFFKFKHDILSRESRKKNSVKVLSEYIHWLIYKYHFSIGPL